MNPASTSEFAAGLARELRGFASLCGEILALATLEHMALAGQVGYQPSDFHQQRKGLSEGLEVALAQLRYRRQLWQQARPADRAHPEEVKSLFENIQNLLTKILLLDRENQQAMLRRGLVPANHLPAAVAGQRPHFVAGLYQRFSAR